MGMPLLSGDRVALLIGATAEAAQQHILFDRDETDSFRIRLEPVRADRRQLTRSEVMPALPVGSRWADAVGWESYVVFPSLAHVEDAAVLIGLEYVVPHPSRGAYPVLAGVVVRAADVGGALSAIATGLDPEDKAGRVPDYGVVASDAQSADEHRPIAAAILRAAGAAFVRGKQLKVRTAILTQDEVPLARTLLPFGATSILLGTVSPLLSRFSWKAKGILGGLS